MRDKIYAVSLSVIFIVLMIWCAGVSLLSKLDIISLPENKNVKLPEKVYQKGEFLAPVLNMVENGKADLENIYANCLPMYEKITVFMLDNERSMRESLLETLYSFEKTDALDLPEAEENSEIETPKIQYKAKRIGTDGQNAVWAFTEADKPYSEGWTDKTLLAGEDELRRRVEIQLGHVNRIANANLNVNFYVYVCTRFQETETFGEIIGDIRLMRGEISTKPLMDEFFAGLDKSAVNGYDYFKVDSLENRLEYIFKTDHHESAQGAYSIYCDVINMIAANSPEIGEPRKLIKFDTFDGVEVRGSHVWGHGYSEIYDDFVYYDVDLPAHTMYTDFKGRKTTERKFNEYDRAKYSRDLFADHYGNYYPRPAMIEYPENNTGRNLLILGDSYTWATGELIGSNFDNTYITLWTHGKFDYNAFIIENNITDVMIMQVADRILYNIQDDTQLDKVLTD